MTNDGTNTLVYDGENRVTSINSGATEYFYDGASLRVKKCAPNCTNPTSRTVYVFSGSKVIAEYDNGASPSSPSREYIFLGSQLLATYEGSTLKYHHADHLSVRVTTDTSGSAVASQGHYPYGESWYQGSGGTKFQFTAYERDSESGNDYAIARYHINRLGRFASPDPVTGSAGNPQSLNRYKYSLNNPVNLMDPLGLSPCGEEEGGHPCPLPMEDGGGVNSYGLGGCVDCQMPLWMLLGDRLIWGLESMGATQHSAEIVATGAINWAFYGGPSTIYVYAKTDEKGFWGFAGVFGWDPPTHPQVQAGYVLLTARLLQNMFLQGFMMFTFGTVELEHISIGVPNGNDWKFCEVLGGTGGQQARCNDLSHAQNEDFFRDHAVLIPASPEQIAALTSLLNYWATPGNSCPSCGSNYNLLTYNSNSFVFNVLVCVGIAPPSLPGITPGYGPRPGNWCGGP